MKLDASLRDRWVDGNDGLTFEMPSGWMQGRSVFGGLTAAAACALAHKHVKTDRVLRTSSINLLRPVVPGVVSGEARVLRAGKGTACVEVRLTQKGEEVATAQLLFVTPRENSVAIEASEPEAFVSPDTLIDLPYIEGVIPEFTQNVRMRWADGGVPFSGSSESRFVGYCQFRDGAGDAEGLVAMLDVWPAPTLSLLKRPTFASTVNWTAHLLEVPHTQSGWYQFEYAEVAGRDGFHTVCGRLYSPERRLIGWTEQLVAIFD